MTASLVLPVGAAFFASCFVNLVARHLAFRFGIVSNPNPIVPRHVKPVAYLGGVGVLVGFLAAWTVAPAVHIQLPPLPRYLVIPAVLFCLLGLYDDLRPLRPASKLIGQVLLAALAVALGLTPRLTGMPPLDGAVTILWIVTCVNAANLTDVCDGLLAGVGTAAFFAWALLAPGNDLALLAAVAMGATLGVLPFNVPRASMFLGDAGSHVIGFLIAALAILTSAHEPAWVPVQLVLLALVPLFELLFVTGVRLAKSLPWWQGSPDHFSLRLQRAGWSEWTIDIFSWCVMFTAVAAGILLPRLSSSARWGILAALLFSGISVTRYLLRWEVRRSG